MSKHKLQKCIITNSKYVEETFKRNKFIKKLQQAKEKVLKTEMTKIKIWNLRNKLYRL